MRGFPWLNGEKGSALIRAGLDLGCGPAPGTAWCPLLGFQIAHIQCARSRRRGSDLEQFPLFALESGMQRLPLLSDKQPPSLVPVPVPVGFWSQTGWYIAWLPRCSVAPAQGREEMFWARFVGPSFVVPTSAIVMW